MPIEVTCYCGKTYTLNDDAIGRIVRCRLCRRALDVPEWPADSASEFLAHFVPPPPPLRTVEPPEASWIATWVASSPPGRGTHASNAALLPYNAVRHLAAYPRWPLAWLGAGAAAFAWAWWLGAGQVAVVLVMLAAAVVYFYRRSCKYYYGDVNPGVVISAAPCRIAVTVGLAIGEGENPSIKIIPAPLVGMPQGATIGTQVVTVTTFHNPEDDVWHDVEPEVAAAGCDNPHALDRARTTIEPKQWQQLNALVAKLPARNPGLYTFWDDNAVGAEQKQRAMLRKGIALGIVCALAMAMPPLLRFVVPSLTPPRRTAEAGNTRGSDPSRFRMPVGPGNPNGTWRPPATAIDAPDPARPALSRAELGALRPGDTIEIWWAGRWQKGTFVRLESTVVRVRTSDVNHEFYIPCHCIRKPK
ncbi:MAG: DUF3239 domain-containing protein [Tepidisphaerales bacterium]